MVRNVLFCNWHPHPPLVPGDGLLAGQELCHNLLREEAAGGGQPYPSGYVEISLVTFN